MVELQPFLGVDEVFLARVLAELRLEGCDDPADVVLGAPVGSRYEDHAVVSRAARLHGLYVQRPEVARWSPAFIVSPDRRRLSESFPGSVAMSLERLGAAQSRE